MAEQRPRCRWPGCRTLLRAGNETGYCGAHVHAALRERWLAVDPRARGRMLSCLLREYDALDILELVDSLEG